MILHIDDQTVLQTCPPRFNAMCNDPGINALNPCPLGCKDLMIGHRSIPALLATLALVLNGLGPAGLVVCIGGDGHVELEAACGVSTQPVACCPSEHQSHDSSVIAEEDHCGNCTDLALVLNPARARNEWSLAMTPGALVALIPPDESRPSRVDDGRAFALLRPPDDVLTSLRVCGTIVLHL